MSSLQHEVEALRARMDFEEKLNDTQALYNILFCICIVCLGFGLLIK